MDNIHIAKIKHRQFSVLYTILYFYSKINKYYLKNSNLYNIPNKYGLFQ